MSIARLRAARAGEMLYKEGRERGETYAHPHCRPDSRDIRRRRRFRHLDRRPPRHSLRSINAAQRLRRRARRDRQPGSDGSLRSRQGMAEGHQHAARQREMDLRRGPGRVRREPEPRLHAVPRRAAEDGAAAQHAAPAARPQHQLPGRRHVARRDDGVAARRGRHRSGHAEMDDGVGRQGRHDRDQGSAGPHSSASTPNGNTASSSPMPTATSSRRGRSGTSCCGARTRCTSARTIPRSMCGSWTTTCR